MFVGHFAIGLAGKVAKPRVSLGTWFAAAQLLDLLWPVFILLGWEHVRIAPGITVMTPLDFYDYPISHSLVGAVGWGAAFAVGYGLLARRRGAGGAGGGGADWGTAALLGLAVVSHWVLDVAVHRPDVPVGPRGPYLGLGLWNAPAVEVTIEVAMFVAAGTWYLRATRARDGVGRFGTWAMLAALLAIWLGAAFGPPPPNAQTLGWMGISLWLFVAWAGWCDRHRELRSLR